MAKISAFVSQADRLKPLTSASRLMILHYVRESGGTICNQDLIRKTGFSKARIACHLTILEQARIVTRSIDRADPRGTSVLVTMVDDPANWRLLDA